MSIPINDIDYCRFLKLAKLIKEFRSMDSEMSIWVIRDSGYVSIEMRGRALPKDKLAEFFEYQPTLDEMEVAKRLLEEAGGEK